MVIVMLAPGNSIHTVRWANAFSQRGHQVHLITQHAALAGLAQGVQVHLLPHHGGLGYVRNGPRVRRLLAKIRPDVVNAHYATGYGTLARQVAPYPLVLNVWGSDVFEFPGKSPLHRRWLRANFAKADNIVATSKVMAERTRSLVGASTSISVVPFGVDLDLFRPRESHQPRTGVVIGTVKRLEPIYGVDVLVEAFARLCRRSELPALHLRLAGAGSQIDVLGKRVNELGLADRVTFVGELPHDKVPDELRRLDIYVALSRQESFGVAVVEASACGVPVVVSDVGGLPEVVMHGSTGLIVPGNDPQAAADALAELVASPEMRVRMGQEGRRFVAEHYGWSPCVDRMLNVLAECAAKRTE